jgi:hypothetical protein
MDITNALVIVGIALVLVILFNVGIYASIKGKDGNKPGTVDLLRNAFNKAKNPWEDEDTALKELSEIVAKLQNEPDGNIDD